MRIHVFVIAVFLTGVPLFIQAQGVGDYQSRASGNWNDLSTWERYNGTSWEPAMSSPSAADGLITIRNPHSVTIPVSQSTTIDQLVINGILNVNGTLSVANGPGVDLIVSGINSKVQVNGTLIRQNLSEISNEVGATAIAFGNGALYDHQYATSVGDMPAATWASTSTLLFSGFKNTARMSANSTWDQQYGNVTFSNPGQKAAVELHGYIRTVRGSLSMVNNSGSPVRLSDDGDFELNIDGDLVINGSSRLVFGAANSVVINIGGDFVFSSNNAAGSYATVSGSTTINLAGDFVANAGTGRFRFTGQGSTGNTVLNMLNGDFQLISGILEEQGSGAAQVNIRFLRAGEQSFRNSGTITGYFNYYVSPATTLNLGTYAVVGVSPSSFVLEGTVIVGSPSTSGAISSSATSGNIRTPLANRVFSPGSTIIYRGTQALYMGSGHPKNADITTIIDNTAGVTLTQNTVLVHPLVLASGTLNIGSQVLTLNSTITTTGGTLGGTENSRLTIGGNEDGAVGTLPFSPAASTLGILDINRAGTGVTVTIGAPLTIHSALNLVKGNLTNSSTLTLRDGVTLTRYDLASLSGNRPVTVDGEVYHVTYRTHTPSGGPYAVMTTGSELPDNDFRLGNFNMILSQALDRLELSHYTTVNGNVTLSRGRLAPNNFGITMNGANWNDNEGNLIPGGGVIIFNGATAIGGTSDPLFGNIQVNPDASVNFTRNFVITGNVSFLPGSIIEMNNVVVTFSGGNPQNVSANGANFSNITVAKSGGQGILLLSRLNLIGLLRFENPSADVNFQSNGHLNLISTSDESGTGTARIYRLLNGNRISGNVVVNRFMSGEGRIYRYISSPITNASVAQLKDDIFIGGQLSDPSPTQEICGLTAKSSNPSLWYYDEAVPGGIDDGWVVYPHKGVSSAASPLAVGRGYAVFIRVCEDPTVIDFVGPINQGPLTLPVTYTPNSSGTDADGWNVVGNPYPSAIDWDAGWVKTRISPMIAINDDAAKMFRYYEPGVTDEIPNGLIAMGQAFHVRATGANPTLRITENAKVGAVPEFFREAAPRIPNFVITLSDGKVRDYAYVKVVADARRTLDDLDAPKIKNENFGLATVSEDKIGMAINAVDGLACGMELPLRTEGLLPGQYSFSLDTRGNFAKFQFVLTDRYTNTQTVLTQAEFDFVVTADSLSAVVDRFTLLVDENANFAPVTVANATACDESVRIDVPDAQRKVKYAVFTASGARLSPEQFADNNELTFPASSLADADADLVLKAISACGAQIAVTQPFRVSTGVPPVASLANQLDCETGALRLVATSSDPTATINWYAREDDTSPIFTGAVFDPGQLEKNRTFFAEVIAGGCSGGRQAITADVTPADAPALITEGNRLVANYGEGTVWYFNDEIIAQDTHSIRADKAGQYHVTINVKGCNLTFYHFQEEVRGLQYYPNPVRDVLTLEGITPDIEKIELLNGLGVNVLNIYEKGRNFDGSVNLAELPDGVYLLVVAGNEEKRSYRIIKGSR